MPPELAAAAGIHDSTAEYVETAKPDVEIGDLDKGSARVLPPLVLCNPSFPFQFHLLYKYA